MKRKLITILVLCSIILGAFTPVHAGISSGLKKFLDEYGPSIFDILGDVFGSMGSDAGSSGKWHTVVVRCPEHIYGPDTVKVVCEQGNKNCTPVSCKTLNP